MRSLSNCLIFALALYFRRSHVADRYLILRGSRLSIGPHFLYGELRRGKMRLVSYKPRENRSKESPPMLFEGVARWGDSN